MNVCAKEMRAYFVCNEMCKTVLNICVTERYERHVRHAHSCK